MIDADGNVFLFGCNDHSQIGTGSMEEKKVSVPFRITLKCKQLSIGGNHTLMLIENDCKNEVYGCGDNARNLCFQMSGGRYTMIPTLCTREAMGVGDRERYGNVVRVIALHMASLVVVEQY